MRHLYLLQRHVFVCACADYAFFLDTRRNKYHCLPARAAQCLSGIIAGWPWPVSSLQHEAPSSKQVDDLIDRLMAAGLLTTSSSEGKQATPVILEPPTAEITKDTEERPDTSPIDALHLASAALRASASIRIGSFERLIRRAARRSSVNVPDSAQWDYAAIGARVAVFGRLRPYFFTAREQCLFQSLTLLNFLAYRRLSPSWVFGVRVAPFAAHCWLQAGRTVLNDTLENVRGYTPIMTV